MPTKTTTLHGCEIVQNNNALIPFICYGEAGFNYDGSEIPFSVDLVQKELDYSGIIEDAFGSITQPTITSDVYIPEDEEASFQHDPIVYVDIMAKDDSGIKEFNLRSQVNLYTWEQVNDSFSVPKFSWTNGIFGSNGASETTTTSNAVWLGTEDDKIYNVEYDSNVASTIYSANVFSEVRNMAVEKGTSSVYISQYDHLSRFLVDSYFADGVTEVEAEEDLTIQNLTRDIISEIHNGDIWSTQAYSGKVVKRNNNLLSVTEYGGFDAPHKVRWSDYHQCYFIAGTEFLWKLLDGEKSTVYNVHGYKINDFDVSPEGYIILALNNGLGRVRVLKNDLFTITFDEIIDDGTASKCQYCKQGKFYALIELDYDGDEYASRHYVFDVINETYETKEYLSSVVEEETEPVFPPPTNKVEIDQPNGGEIWELGQTQDIKWRSTESVTDGIKIELYQDDELVDVIAEVTNNTGVYNWKISNSYDSGNYKVKLTWLAATADAANESISENVFKLTNITPDVDKVTVQIIDKAVDIGYNIDTDDVLVALGNGLLGAFNLGGLSFNGMFDVSVPMVTSMVIHGKVVKESTSNSKVRVFVGTELHLSDKWDSGIIETELNSIYYGGGNNLVPGERYYVNIQVYSDEFGWSNIQTKEWTMPR